MCFLEICFFQTYMDCHKQYVSGRLGKRGCGTPVMMLRPLYSMKYQMTQLQEPAIGSRSDQNAMSSSEIIVYFCPTCTR